MASKKKEKTEMLLLEEYKGIVQQIIHWNSHFWAKSQFFLVIESAFVAGAAGLLQKYFFFSEVGMTWSVLGIFAFIAFLNGYLCFVWFRTNRRNQEFLELRFARAKKIEKSLGTLHLFQDHDDENHLPKCHRSGGWERHLATVFGVAWLTWLSYAIFLKVKS